MKQILLPLICAAAFAATAAQNNLKIMTYNIKNAHGMDNVMDLQRVANTISKAHPHVVAIEEVDSMTERSNKQYVLGELAKRTRMQPYFFPAIDYDGGKYGIGLLTRKQPLSIKQVSLPGREEARTMFVADFADFTFIGTHLSLTPEDRMASLKIINEIADTCSKPLFIAGDFNDTPRSELLEGLNKKFTTLNNVKTNTFPADHPSETIDYIMALRNHPLNADTTANHYTLLYAKVIDDSVSSDHRPVVARVRLNTPADKIMGCDPYLQNPTENGITVMWETNVPTDSWIEYGTDSLNLKKTRTFLDGQAVCNNTLQKIRLSNLIPGKKYYYRVYSREMLDYQGYYKAFGHTAISPLYSFELPTPATNSFTALVFNDLHQHSATFRALMDQVKDVDYDFAVFNGDCIDDPANRKQASRFIKELTEGVDASHVPVFFMRGNHEIRNAYSVGLRDHFDYPGNKPYSAISWGDTRIVMLDCGEDKPDTHPVYYGLNDFASHRADQAEFLKQELASKAFKKADKRILINHIPLWGNTEPNLCYELWEPILRKAPFDVNLSAHTHEFAYHPTNSQGNPYPLIIGGGYKMDKATVTILTKTKGKLQVKVLDTHGKIIIDLTL